MKTQKPADADKGQFPHGRAVRLGLIAVLAILVLALTLLPRKAPGCDAYTPSGGLLIAHAGGGLPDAIYPNNRAAIDLAVEHGFDLIELDFSEKQGELTIWHEGYPPSDMTVADLGIWLKKNPRIRIVADIKTNVMSGLAHIKRDAPGMEHRFIPEIHEVSQFQDVEQLGFPDQILATYWYPSDDTSWASEADKLPLFGVALPVGRKDQATLTRHLPILHTVNKSMLGYGLYTDCMVPLEFAVE